MKKKICVVTPEFPPHQWGGLARSAARAAGYVRDMGFEVHVAHFFVVDTPLVLLDENRSTERLDGLTVHRICVGRESFSDGIRELWDCPHTLTLQMMYQSLEKLHRLERYHIFHSYFLYPVGYVTGLLARRFHTPHVATIVGNDVKKYIFSPEKAALCRSALENADIVAALSVDLMEMADALTPICAKTRIVYNSVEIPKQIWDKRRSAEFVIGCAGIFKYAKGLPYLLKACAMVAQRHTIRLELVGHVRPAERPILDEMLGRIGDCLTVNVRPPMDHEKISDWFLNLDAYALPSLTEGCPNILMEAMAAGTPCVAAQTGAVEELMDHGSSGLIVPWGDSHALAEALERIISAPETARSLGAAARAKMGGFTAEHEAAAWLGIYKGERSLGMG